MPGLRRGRSGSGMIVASVLYYKIAGRDLITRQPSTRASRAVTLQGIMGSISSAPSLANGASVVITPPAPSGRDSTGLVADSRDRTAVQRLCLAPCL